MYADMFKNRLIDENKKESPDNYSGDQKKSINLGAKI